MRLVLACLIAASLGGTAIAQGRPSAVDFQGFAALTGEVGPFVPGFHRIR